MTSSSRGLKLAVMLAGAVVIIIALILIDYRVALAAAGVLLILATIDTRRTP